jgi:hypothetical protein
MPFEVLLSEQAERDVEDIYRTIAGHDDVKKGGSAPTLVDLRLILAKRSLQN